MRFRSRAPSVVESPLPKHQEHVNIVASTIDQPQKREPVFKAQLKLRDEYRGVITGQLDTDLWQHQGEPENVYLGPAEGAHIIPVAFAS